MINPDNKVLGSLSILMSSPEYQIVLDWFRQSLVEADKNNRLLDGPQLYRGQGEALVLQDLIDKSTKANQLLENRKNIERKRQDHKPGFL